ncbi:MAG TPA: hypothetical protein VK205_05710 [Prolixibacteraceae bacterium]|nr:hypothetical protein [Prolixibacteraceae bacterium]
MKTLRLIVAIVIVVFLQSCHEPGNIKVQNNITKVKIEDVKWGDNYLAYELLPGETSEETTIRRDDESLPASHKLSFKMTANDKTIYLETEEEYILEEEGSLFIILTDTTKVKNPNE